MVIFGSCKKLLIKIENCMMTKFLYEKSINNFLSRNYCLQCIKQLLHFLLWLSLHKLICFSIFINLQIHFIIKQSKKLTLVSGLKPILQFCFTSIIFQFSSGIFFEKIKYFSQFPIAYSIVDLSIISFNLVFIFLNY